MRRWQRCVKKAKLVALQLKLLPSDIHILNLQTEQVAQVLPKIAKASHVSLLSSRMFHVNLVSLYWLIFQVRILVDAYREEELWSRYIFHVFIVSGDFKRMKEVQYQCSDISKFAEAVSRL